MEPTDNAAPTSASTRRRHVRLPWTPARCGRCPCDPAESRGRPWHGEVMSTQTAVPVPDSMRAARFDQARRELAVTDVAVPVPGRGEVLVRVRACGICLSDVHLLDGSLPGSLPVLTPGHEAAGEVAALGEDVVGWAVGQRAVLAAGKPCGVCPACTRGLFDRCRALQIMGFAFDGAWAEYVVVPAQLLTAIPDGMPIEQAAILADAVATPYAGLVDRAGLRAGESVGLWGIGGLGVHAVQVARMVGATPIVAVDPLPEARERALALGADLALDPADPTLSAQIAAATGGEGLDVAVDLVGSDRVLAQAFATAGQDARVLVIGMAMDPGTVPSMAIFGVLRQTLLGHLGYRKEHLDQLVALVSSGRLDVSRSVSGTLPLEDVADGVERLTSKRGNPVRLVVLP